MHKKAVIVVSGTVQGIGFRPFVYRVAKALSLGGCVKNLGDAGVEIIATGPEKAIERLLEKIKSDAPAGTRIENISIDWSDIHGDAGVFTIARSGGSGAGGIIPQDAGICDTCGKELLSRDDRRRLYPMITCTDCGPRFSALEKVPFDRKNLSYSKFPPCKRCAGEYADPKNRRFHAQTIACPECGPKYVLLDKKGKKIGDPIKSAAKLIREGNILAIKGVGGMHLSCLAKDDRAVAELRKRRGRREQPFAVLASLDEARKFAVVGKRDEDILSSRERPIVLLKKSGSYVLSELVSPGLDTVGVMLPYTGLHLLLLKEIGDAIVMTSANRSGLPMMIDNREIAENGVADCFLIHDLEIKNRCDDSVVKVVNGVPGFLRRSRGFVPRPVRLDNPTGKTVLALGAEENDTFCILKGDKAYISQHIGNTFNLPTMDYLEDALARFQKLIPARFDLVACDLHPSFNTTRKAEELGRKYKVPVIKVQHHHAHLLSLAGEHGLGSLVGICCDGTGYGLDGKSWGGEVFSLEGGKIERCGHLLEQRMPGGDLAVRYPARMAAGILYESVEEEELMKIIVPGLPRGTKEAQIIIRQMEKGINVPKTSSTGRVLDAAAYLLGVCAETTYDGEPAMKLETAAQGGRDLGLPLHIKNNIIDTSLLLKEAVSAKKDHPARDVAYSLLIALAKGFAKIALDSAEKEGIDSVGISGGVAYNDLFVRTIASEVKEGGLGFYQNRQIPCGDGGISYGQAAYALQKIKLK